MGMTSNRWEKTGFGDDLRHLRSEVARGVQRARQALRKGVGPRTKEELAHETVSLASRGQRLSPESIEWLLRYAGSYTRGWRWEPNFCVANLYRSQETLATLWSEG